MNKQCPFTYSNRVHDCKPLFCAWYDSERNQCIIHTIAQNLNAPHDDCGWECK